MIASLIDKKYLDKLAESRLAGPFLVNVKRELENQIECSRVELERLRGEYQVVQELLSKYTSRE